jgi:Heterokaryon incompatibility protein (HET)
LTWCDRSNGDWICIDQQCKEERPHQVSLMGKIFAGAQTVFAYLGDGLDCSKRSYKHDLAQLQDTAPTEFRTWNGIKSDFPALPSSDHPTRPEDAAGHVFAFLFRLAKAQHLDSLPPFLLALNEKEEADQRYLFELVRIFTQSRCFNRIWIVQEVVLVRCVELIYGSASADWSMFVAACRNWVTHAASCCARTASLIPLDYRKVMDCLSQAINSIEEVRVRYQQKIPPLLSLLRRFRSRAASDPRDKVYALLAISSEGRLSIDGTLQPAIQPDYSLEASEVFVETTTTLIRETGSLSVIAGDVGILRKYRAQLPTWVPDWSAAREGAADLSHFFLASSHRPDALTPLNVELKAHEQTALGHPIPSSFHILHLSCLRIDRVAQIGPAMPIDNQISWEVLQDWARLSSRERGYLKVFGRIVCSNVIIQTGTMITSQRERRRMVPSDILPFSLWVWTLSPHIDELENWMAGSEARWDQAVHFARTCLKSNVETALPNLRDIEVRWNHADHLVRSGLQSGFRFKPGGILHRIQVYWSETSLFVRNSIRPDFEGSIQEGVKMALQTIRDISTRLPDADDLVRASLESGVEAAQAIIGDIIRYWLQPTVYTKPEMLDPAATDLFIDKFGQRRRDAPSDADIKNALAEDFTAFDISVRTATVGRRLFITNNGFVGLGPADMTEKDTLVLLKGGRAPFLLRESCDHKGCGKKLELTFESKSTLSSMHCFFRHSEAYYKTEIVGDCYVHGIMDGEIEGSPDFQPPNYGLRGGLDTYFRALRAKGVTEIEWTDVEIV